MTDQDKFLSTILLKLPDLTWSNDLKSNDFRKMIEDCENIPSLVEGYDNELEQEIEMSSTEVFDLINRLQPNHPTVFDDLNVLLTEINKREEREASFLYDNDLYTCWVVDEAVETLNLNSLK